MILDISEEMFNKGPEFFIENTNCLDEQASEYLTDNMDLAGLTLLEHEISCSPNNAEVLYGYALSLARLGRYEEAMAHLDSELFKTDCTEEAQRLREDIVDLVSPAEGIDLSEDQDSDDDDCQGENIEESADEVTN